MSRKIGKVVAVSGSRVTVEVDRNISDLHVRHEGHTYTVGQPGSYLIVDRDHDKHLILVTTVRKGLIDTWPVEMSEPAVEGLPQGQFPYLPMESPRSDRTLIDGIMIGTISGNRFEIGITRPPVAGDDVSIALKEYLAVALAPPKNRYTISIGRVVDSSIPVHLDLDDLLGKHTAIVGNTGSGKSYTVARLLQEITGTYPSSNIILFDLHGEYSQCFSSARYIRADQLSLPAWLHSFEDLFALCADLSNQYNIHNQRWAFREGIFKLKQRYCEEVLQDAKLAENIDLDSPIPFDFQHLLNYLHNLNSATERDNGEPAYSDASGSHDLFRDIINYDPPERGKVFKGPLHGELDRLLLRVQSRSRDPRYAFIFQYPPPQRGDLERLVRQVTGLVSDPAKPITVFDLSYLPSETVGVVVATVSRILFQTYFLAERDTYIPTLVVYEEAHNYISRKGRGAYGDAREVAERIVKEGRKFGIGAIVVSQRPSELSDTMLSQCSTFLCMRLTNPEDRGHINSMLPDSMQGLVEALPALPRGHIIAVGQATKLPVRFVVDKFPSHENEPNSHDPEFGAKWSVQPTMTRSLPPIAEICERWMRSQKPRQVSLSKRESEGTQQMKTETVD